MDGDGDLDIISLAWRDYQNLHLWRNDAISPAKPQTVAANQKYGQYFLPIDVEANGHDRFDKPVEVNINFTDMVNRAGGKGAFATQSMRLVEVGTTGQVLDESVAYQFETKDDYNEKERAVGTLIFIMKGKTEAQAIRHYRMYFNTGTTEKKASSKSMIQVEKLNEYEGDEAFKIVTSKATYYYHKHGSGFASLIDNDGNDWVSFHPNQEPEDGFKGRYRGIPNVAPGGFHPGRGEGKKKSVITQQGPIKVQILSETEDQKWGCLWDIYPSYATMTLFKKGDGPFWILYEGTPGGSFENERDFWMNSQGDTVFCKDYMRTQQERKSWAEDLPNPEWVVFADKNLSKKMYYVHHESEDAVDCYWNRQDGGMTVFGFGRDPEKAGGEGWQRLNSVPTHLTVGFTDASDFYQLKKEINSAFRLIRLSIGQPMAAK